VTLWLDGNMRKCGKTSSCTSTSRGWNAHDRISFEQIDRPRAETFRGRNVHMYGANRPGGESSRGRNVKGTNRPGAKCPGGEASRQGEKRLGGETSSYRRQNRSVPPKNLGTTNSFSPESFVPWPVLRRKVH